MRFRQQSVLRDITLTIERGQTVCIIGESGCGKTVMLKLMIGLLRPSRGVVKFDGRDLATLNEQEMVKVRLRFGFLFQNAALFDSLTIFDNVAFGPREHNLCDRRDARPGRRRPAPGGRPAPGPRAEEARRTLRRPAEAGRAWPGPSRSTPR